MPFTEPDRLHTDFSAALRAGDVDALVEMYEQGAVQLLPDGSVSDDRDALRTMFQGLVDGGPLPETIQRFAVKAGGLALTSTGYTFPRPDGGEAVMVTAEVSRQQPDGSWRVAIDAPTFFTQGM